MPVQETHVFEGFRVVDRNRPRRKESWWFSRLEDAEAEQARSWPEHSVIEHVKVTEVLRS